MFRWVVVVLIAGCGRLGFDDATAIDAPPLDATPRVPCTIGHPGAMLCEGFEPVDVAWDYQVITNGHAARSTTRAVLGNASLGTGTDDIDDYKYARWGRNNVLPNINAGDYYLREFVYMTASTVVTEQLSIMTTGNMNDPFPSTNVMLKPGEIHIATTIDEYAATREFPRDRWVCVELHIGVDTTTGVLDVALDGETIVSVSNVNTHVAGGYTNVDVGVHYATPAQTPATIWYDEVVADRSPIGCN